MIAIVIAAVCLFFFVVGVVLMFNSNPDVSEFAILLSAAAFFFGIVFVPMAIWRESRGNQIEDAEKEYNIEVIDWGHTGEVITYENSDGNLCFAIRGKGSELYEQGCN